MTNHNPAWPARAGHSGVRLVPAQSYSSSPGDRSARPAEVKAYCQVPDASRSGQELSPGSRLQLHSSRHYGYRSPAACTARALPESAGHAAATQNVPVATATKLNPEAIRLITAATILSASSSASDAEEASATNSLNSFDEDCSSISSLSVLDEMTVLNADSLALVVGILRQHQPLEADEADMQLSERLRDLLLLLRQRPRSPTPAAGSLPTAAGQSVVTAGADAEAFWAAPDEWADVRSALMSIGINASTDEEDDEDVWAMEEEGPARRTRLLRSLPRLDAQTPAALAAFLAEQQQRDAVSDRDRPTGETESKLAGSQLQGQPQRDDAVAGIDAEQEERWWEEVTQAYQQLWQQARLQQAKQAELGEAA